LKLALLLSLLFHAVALAAWGIRNARPASGVGRVAEPLAVFLPASESLSTVQRTDAKVVQGDLTDTAEGSSAQGDPSALVLVPSEVLTDIPFALEEIEVDFPEVKQPRSGVVRLKLAISASGQVISAYLLETDLPYEYVERAISTFASQRFSPGKIGQLEVPTAIEIEVSFDAEGVS
jgi:hypothetical protein